MQIPTDISDHNQYIPAQNLKSQKWLDIINENYKFTTRLMLNEEIVEVLDSTRLLGTIITSDLKWDANTANIVKQTNARMQ